MLDAKMDWSREISQKGLRLHELVGGKASFDVVVMRHEQAMGRLDDFSYAVAEKDRQKLRSQMKEVTAAEELLRDGDPSNDQGAIDALTQAVTEMSELAAALRPSSSQARIVMDVFYGLTYGAALGTLAHQVATDAVLGGRLGLMAVGAGAVASAVDALRISGVRWDEVRQLLSGKPAANELPVAESPLFKKWASGLDDGLSFVGGLGLMGLALSRLPVETYKDVVRIVGISGYTVTSGLQLLEGLRRGYADASPEQRKMFLRSKVAAGGGAAGLVMASLIAGGLIERGQPAAPPAQVLPSSPMPSDLMRGHGPPYRPPIHRTVMIDSDHPDTAGSLWAIARSNIDWILTPEQQAKLDGAAEYQAAQRLSQFNGLNPRLMDGKLTHAPGDPDTLHDGWKVNVNMLGLTRPPSS